MSGGANDGVDINDTVSYADLTAGVGVTVDLNITSSQNTGGAGSDTITNVENLIGSNYADTLKGTNSSNILGGLGGNDTIDGRGGSDVIIGGKGSDNLTGGSSSDTFVWQAGDDTGNPTDRITDFTVGGGNGDKLDLSDLLVDEHSDPVTLDAYLSFSSVNSNQDTQIAVDADGAGPSASQQLIILQGVQMASLGGTDQAAISTLIAANALLTSG
ncbi:MAG: type I secretion C-terminal target domain-containing protein [Legionella sp.]|nr:MAG: type I secretion C-terminal target domain-containing protein [Legionella sp.]